MIVSRLVSELNDQIGMRFSSGCFLGFVVMERYRRQMNVPGIGEAGQRKISGSRVVIIGCGALGTAQANLLARAGIGDLTIVDRDFVDLSNLQRQSLFDENDVQQHRPKAVAAADRLKQINSDIEVRPIVADVGPENILSLIETSDIVLDGTDNFETRYLINDACCKLSKSWIFGGCLSAAGQAMAIQPGKSSCLACLMPEVPNAGALPTCDTGGILGSIIQAVASIQFTLCIKLLTQPESVSLDLTYVDLWEPQFRQINLKRLRDRGGCRVCWDKEFDWLSGNAGSQSKVMCGRNSVQISPQQASGLSLAMFQQQWKQHGEVLANDYLVRLTLADYSLTLFPDGRLIVTGTEDPAVARSLYAQFVGT